MPSAASSVAEDQPPRPYYHLPPSGGPIHVVRWPRRDRTEIRQRYFRRGHDAEVFARLLEDRGYVAVIFRSPTDWTEVER